MKRIIAKRTIREFWEKHPYSKYYLQNCYETVKGAIRQKPEDIKQFYATASNLKNSRVAFNIQGNDYRLLDIINYQKQWLFIRFVGTHKEKDKINSNPI